MKRWPRRSTRRLCYLKKSAPKSARLTSARITWAWEMRPSKHKERFRVPYVGVGSLKGRITWACASVITGRRKEERKLELQCLHETRRPQCESRMNSCGSGWPADEEATAGPPWRFPLSVWEIYCSVVRLAGTSLRLCQTYGDTTIWHQYQLHCMKVMGCAGHLFGVL